MKIKYTVPYKPIAIILYLFSTITFSTQKASAATDTNLSLVKVRDFKNFREFQFKNSKIIFQKDKNYQRIFFIQGAVNLKVTQDKSHAFFEYQIKDKTKTHHVFAHSTRSKKTKIAYYSKSFQKYFKEDPNLSCPTYTSALNKDFISSLSKKVNSLTISKLFDSASCKKLKEDDLNALIETAQQGFDPESSPLVQCFQSKKVIDILNKNQNLGNIANGIFSRYIDLSDKISVGDSALRITCDLDKQDKTKTACYNEQTRPESIAFNPSFITDFSKASLPAILNHELFHFGSQQIPSVNNQLDENVVEYFSCLCTNANDSEIKKDLSATCKSDKLLADVQGIPKSQNASTSFSGGQAAVLGTATEELGKTDTIAKFTESVTFTPLNSTKTDQLANSTLQDRNGAPIAQDGSLKEAHLDSTTLENLNSITTSLYNTAAPTTKAVALALTQPATAGGTSVAINPTTSSRSPASASNVATPTAIAASAVEPVSMKEMTATIYSEKLGEPDKNSIALANALFPDTTQQSGSDTKLASKTTATSTFGVAPTNSGAATASKLNQSSSSSSQNINPTSDDNTDPNLAIAPTTASSAATRSAASTETSQAQTDNPAVRALASVSRVSGDSYLMVKSQYSDPAFEQQLRDRKISITVTDAKGNARVLNSSKDATIKFVDNGKGLVKITK